MATNDEKLKVGDRVETGRGPSPVHLAHEFAALIPAEELTELHSIEPWLIMQAKPNCEKIAVAALMREGFEAWYPTYRHFTPIPKRKIASHMRHKYRDKVQCRIRPLFAGYVLIRRLFGNFDVTRLFDLQGCGGLCVFDSPRGPVPATISDHQVELLRLRVADHGFVFERYDGSRDWKSDDVVDVTGHALIKSGILDDPKVRNPWPIRGRVAGKLDDSLGISLFFALGDRVVRVVRTPRDAEKTNALDT